MNEGPLNRSDVLKLRQEAVARSEASLKRNRSKGTRARHTARLQLGRNRRALEALQEVMDAQH